MNKWQQSKRNICASFGCLYGPVVFFILFFFEQWILCGRLHITKYKSKLIDHYLVHFVCFAFFFSLTSIDFFVFFPFFFYIFLLTHILVIVLIWCSTVFVLLIFYRSDCLIFSSMKCSSVHMLDDFVRIRYLLFMSHIKPSFYFATRIDSFMICFLLLIIGCQMYCACLFSCVFFLKEQKKSAKG